MFNPSHVLCRAKIYYLAALACALAGNAHADVRFGYDGHSKTSVSFIEFNTVTQDVTLTQVPIKSRRLTRPTTALVRFGSGANRGRWVKVQADPTTGLVTRLTASDNSRIDLQWSKTTGYRSALIVLRDNHGRQRLMAQLTGSPTARQPMAAAKSISAKFGKSPPDFYSWKDWGLAGTAEDVSNWDVGPVDMSGVGQAVTGLLDQTDHIINTLINQMIEIPELVHGGGGVGLLVARELAQTVAEASGMVDQAREYVGDLAGNLLDHGVSSPLQALQKASTAAAVVADALGRTVLGNYNPTIPSNGFATLRPPGVVYKGDKTTLDIAREGGNAGILSGRIMIAPSSGIRPVSVSFEGGPYYVFLDGATKPQLLRMDVSKSAANGRSLVLDLDEGNGLDGTTRTTVEGAPPNTSFSVNGSGGESGASIGTATGCSFTSSMYLSGQVNIRLTYNSRTKTASASVDAVITTDNGSFDYTWDGPMTWNGAAFTGSLARSSASNRPPMPLTISPGASGTYTARGIVPFTMYLFKTDGSCTGPVETFNYTLTGATLH